MKAAFIDTSAMAAILFKEPNAPVIQKILADLGAVYASNLLEAEIRSAVAREGMDQAKVDKAITSLSLFQPDRSLTQEFKLIVSMAPTLRGADLWHVACALNFAGDPSALPFITLDGNQSRVASRLGFRVLPWALPSGPGAQESPAPYRTSKPKGKKRRNLP